MPISVTCPGCSKVIKVPDQYAGKSGKCPGCGTKIAIPAAAAPQPAAAKPVVAKPIVAKPLAPKAAVPQPPVPQPPVPQSAAPQPAAAQEFNPQAFNFTTKKAPATPAAAPPLVVTTPKAAPLPQVAVAPAANPYASPAAVGEPAPIGPTLEDAHVFRRMLNWFIDNIVVNVLAFAFGIGIFTMMIPTDGTRPKPGSLDTAFMLACVVGMLMPFLYSFLLELACQKTLGKMITGTKVVRMDGSRPSPFQFLGRALARYIPFEPFSFIGSEKPRGWHDRLSGTRVVRQ